MSNDDFWRSVRSRLAARPEEAAQVPRDIERLPERAMTARVARFVIDVFDGDAVRVAGYLDRFEKCTEEPVFARAVRREVERILSTENTT